MVADNDGGDSCGRYAKLLIHPKEKGLVGGVVVDLELLEIEIRVAGLYFRNKRFYIIAVAAPVAVEKVPDNRAIQICSEG